MKPAPPVQADTGVAQILRTYPQTAKVFISQRTDCVGCMAARFCTLQNVAADYGLDLEHLLAELRAVIHPQISPTEEQ